MRKQMIKIFFLLAIMLVYSLGNISTINKVSAQTRETKGEVLGFVSDWRIIRLEEFLTKNGSPLASFAPVFVVAADIYRFDWRLLPAIAGQESFYGRKIPWDKVNGQHSFNPFGWGIYSGQVVSFGSWEDGILKVAAGLRREYFDEELLTTDLVMKKFTPPSDGSWARGVEIIMEKISPYGFDRKEVKNNMLTLLLAQKAITATPSPEVAAATIQTITDFTAAFGTWQMMFIAIFLAADIILGIAGAIASKEFNFNKVAAFMKTGVIPYLFGFAVVELLASQFGQLGQIATTVIFVAIVVNLLGSIISSLANLGIHMPTVFKKR